MPTDSFPFHEGSKKLAGMSRHTPHVYRLSLYQFPASPQEQFPRNGCWVSVQVLGHVPGGTGKLVCPWGLGGAGLVEAAPSKRVWRCHPAARVFSQTRYWRLGRLRDPENGWQRHALACRWFVHPPSASSASFRLPLPPVHRLHAVPAKRGERNRRLPHDSGGGECIIRVPAAGYSRNSGRNRPCGKRGQHHVARAGVRDAGRNTAGSDGYCRWRDCRRWSGF